jgi:hypothetical protein
LRKCQDIVDTAEGVKVVVVPADEPQRVIHVNVLQPKNYDYL